MHDNFDTVCADVKEFAYKVCNPATIAIGAVDVGLYTANGKSAAAAVKVAAAAGAGTALKAGGGGKVGGKRGG